MGTGFPVPHLANTSPTSRSTARYVPIARPLAACRNPSGCGLPLRISSTGTITFGRVNLRPRCAPLQAFSKLKSRSPTSGFEAHAKAAWLLVQPECLQAVSPRNDPFLPAPWYGLAPARSAPSWRSSDVRVQREHYLKRNAVPCGPPTLSAFHDTCRVDQSTVHVETARPYRLG